MGGLLGAMGLEGADLSSTLGPSRLRMAMKYNAGRLRKEKLRAPQIFPVIRLGLEILQRREGAAESGRFDKSTIGMVRRLTPPTELDLSTYVRRATAAATGLGQDALANARAIQEGKVSAAEAAFVFCSGVEVLQRAAVLSVDGKVGPRTRDLLLSWLETALGQVADGASKPGLAIGGPPRGKGMFLSGLHKTGGPAEAAKHAQNAGLDWVALLRVQQHPNRKTTHWNTASLAPHAKAFQDAGIKVWLWGWCMPDKERAFVDETMTSAQAVGALGVIADMEAAYREREEAARKLMDMLLDRAHAVGMPVGVTSYGAPWFHKTLPWGQLARGDFGIPQIYDARKNLGPSYPARSVDAWRQMGPWKIVPAFGTFEKSGRELAEHLDHFPEDTPALVGWQWRTTSPEQWKVIERLQVRGSTARVPGVVAPPPEVVGPGTPEESWGDDWLPRGVDGPEVLALQNALLRLSYDLPRYGADGDCGDETIEAATEYAEAQGLAHFDEAIGVPRALVKHILNNASAVEAAAPVPGELIDYRASYVGGKAGRRNIRTVDTICLHQTATHFGERTSRYKKLKVHHACTREGKAIWLVDYDTKVWHGHGWNSRSVGIEIDGYFAGVDGDLRTFWKPKSRPNRRPMKASESQVQAVRATIRFICEEVARRGGKIEYIVSHRQAYGMKISDPGEILWKTCAIWAQEELGLSDGGGDFTLHHKNHPGRPIPEAWDPKHKGVPYR